MIKAKIKIKFKLVPRHQLMIKAPLVVKARSKTVVMTKWLLKNQVKKLKLVVNQRLIESSASEVTTWMRLWGM